MNKLPTELIINIIESKLGDADIEEHIHILKNLTLINKQFKDVIKKYLIPDIFKKLLFHDYNITNSTNPIQTYIDEWLYSNNKKSSLGPYYKTKYTPISTFNIIQNLYNDIVVDKRLISEQREIYKQYYVYMPWWYCSLMIDFYDNILDEKTINDNVPIIIHL